MAVYFGKFTDATRNGRLLVDSLVRVNNSSSSSNNNNNIIVVAAATTTI